jgi:radical SAM superfamily enzyme YgiQ (UPF0313 family)
MKKIVLASLSAKFIHSSLALRYLTKFNDNAKKHNLTTMEFTINQRLDFIADELFRAKPDVILFSCYIWNVDMLKSLCPLLKKIMPNCIIGFGGPEVSYEAETFLRENEAVDLIMRGEGELVFSQYLDYLDFGTPSSLHDIKSMTFRDGDRIVSTMQQEPLDLSLLPFPYEEDFHDVENQIIYYESSRGCPYSCGYCLSSIEKGVRFVPLEKVYTALQKFLDHKVRQVKFIDRTFNCKKSHAMGIWRYLAEHDNGVTNFHFEITADLLDQETIAFLHTVRKGLFQFEIGVQSTNPKTIEAINRNVNFEKLSGIVQQIKAGGNIHQHLDLIAGLPHEDYASFARSFNDVYALKPEQLQLGFLKVLKGSMIYNRQHDFSIVYQDTAPYEVLTTHMLPYEDTLKLKAVEEMVETYYNSGKFLNTLEYLVPLYDTPFAFFEQLSQYWIAEKCHYQYQSKIGLCNILWQFAQQNHAVDLTKMQWLIKFDLALHEKPKKLPEWLVVSNEKRYRNQITAFYRDTALVEQYLPHYCGIDSKVIARQTHLEVFGEVQPVAILFDYEHKDLLQNAQYMMIPLEELAQAEANLRMEK